MKGVPLQLQPLGQSLGELQRWVQVLLTQCPPVQLATQGPPTSG